MIPPCGETGNLASIFKLLVLLKSSIIREKASDVDGKEVLGYAQSALLGALSEYYFL